MRKATDYGNTETPLRLFDRLVFHKQSIIELETPLRLFDHLSY